MKISLLFLFLTSSMSFSQEVSKNEYNKEVKSSLSSLSFLTKLEKENLESALLEIINQSFLKKRLPK